MDQATRLTIDPCRFIRQVKQFARLEPCPLTTIDPCRFIRQVKQFARLTGEPR